MFDFNQQSWTNFPYFTEKQNRTLRLAEKVVKVYEDVETLV